MTYEETIRFKNKLEKYLDAIIEKYTLEVTEEVYDSYWIDDDDYTEGGYEVDDSYNNYHTSIDSIKSWFKSDLSGDLEITINDMGVLCLTYYDTLLVRNEKLYKEFICYIETYDRNKKIDGFLQN